MKESNLKRNINTGSAGIAAVCCLLSFLAYTSMYTGRSTLTTLAGELNLNGLLDPRLFGLACSLFSIIYAVGRLVSGYCADLISSKKMIFTGVFASGLSNVFIGVVMNPYATVALWALNALAQSIIWGSLLVVAAAVCTETQKTGYLMVLGMTIGCGQVAGFILIPVFVKIAGLKAGFIFPGLISILIALSVIIFFPEVPAKGNLSEFSLKRITDNTMYFFRDKEYLSILFPCVANGIIRDGIAYWLASYIMTEFGVDLSAMALFAVAVPAVNVLGKFIFPSLYRVSGNDAVRMGFLSFSIITLLLIPMCFRLTSPIIAVVCLACAYMFDGTANTTFTGMWPMRFASTNRVAMAAGMIDTVIYMGSGISSVLFGFMVSSLGFRSMYMTLMLCSLLSTVILAFSASKSGN